MTKQVQNVSRFGGLDVPLLGRHVDRGETVDVPDEVAAALLTQPRTWKLAPAAEPTAPAAQTEETSNGQSA